MASLWYNIILFFFFNCKNITRKISSWSGCGEGLFKQDTQSAIHKAKKKKKNQGYVWLYMLFTAQLQGTIYLDLDVNVSPRVVECSSLVENGWIS